MKRLLTREQLFEMIANGKISSGEGFKLYKELQQKFRVHAFTSASYAGPSTTMYYQSVWEKSVLAKPVPKPGKEFFGLILIFDINALWRDALSESLKSQKKKTGTGSEAAGVILVKPGNRFHQEENQVFEIDLRESGHYRKLMGIIVRQHQAPIKIIHRWSHQAFTRQSDEESLHAQLQESVYSLLYLSRALMELKIKIKDRVPLLYIYPGFNDEPQPHYASYAVYAGVSAFVKTLCLENPVFCCKTIELPTLSHELTKIPGLPEVVLNEFAAGDDEVEVRYDGKQRYVRRLREFTRVDGPGGKSSINGPVKLREKGVYLITGGAGGLGLIFAKYLVRQVNAAVILIGRSDLNAEKNAKIQEIKSTSPGSEVMYVKADISRRKDAEYLLKKIKKRFNRLNGIIHNAGVTRDAFITRKTSEEVEAVLAPKVYGTVYLDEAFKKEKLDFFVMSSSVAAITGNVGQSDYAYANSFMDGYAREREKQRKKQKQRRYGKTISINWPYWQEGGMKISKEIQAGVFEPVGIEEMPTGEGIKALEFALQCHRSQLVVVYGNREKISRVFDRGFSQQTGPPTIKAQSLQTAVDPGVLFEKTEGFLKKVFGEILKLPIYRIDSRTRFEEYGIDSIMINIFNSKVEKELGSIPKTLLFDYQTLHELTGYFVNYHGAELAHFFQLEPRHTSKDSKPNARRAIKSFDQTFSKDWPRAGPPEAGEDIAIIGLSGRYPLARNLEEYWDNLKKGKDCITEIPASRWDYRDYYDPDMEKAKMYCKWGGFLEDIDRFDPLIFNISPREAEMIDPQERIFLETVWSTLEDAGYSREEIKRHIHMQGEKGNRADVGVFVGTTNYSYYLFGPGGNLEMALSNPSSIANRVSFIFNFQGPSMPVDTACSSSLTAIHLACESLKKGECQLALAGGVNLYLHPSKYLFMCSMRMLSGTGRCHTFGEGADGFIPGEGVGAVLLKLLGAAIRDRDHIYAVIKGSAINHGGRTNGYTIPSPNSQARVIAQALGHANIDPRTISYIEAHGTGTSLGDPIEIQGLSKAYGKYTKDKQYCAIGSVKSNIGHLESAAGIAGLTKVLLQLKHKQLVPSLHSDKLNPKIDFENSPFYVQQELAAWKQPYPYRAGISSFGAGGSNAHIILDEYENQTPVPQLDTSNQGSQLIILSAQSEEQLKEYAGNLANFLGSSDSSISRHHKTDRELQQSVQWDLLKYVSGILKVHENDLDINENMTEYGFEPIHLSGLSNRINQEYGTDITPGLFAKYTSIRAAAVYLSEEYVDCLKNHYLYLENGRESAQASPIDTPASPLRLSDIAFTLQLGREPMNERIAVIAFNTKTLRQNLSRYSRGESDIESFYRGNAKANKALLESLFKGRGGENHIEILLKERDFGRLARLWVSGLDIAWQLLYPSQAPRRISLPTYPFKRKRYWLSTVHSVENIGGSPIPGTPWLHPLIDRLDPGRSLDYEHGLVFKKTLQKTDLIMKHHQVNNQCLLPGVGYLEMVYAAFSQINPERKFNIHRVALLQPLVVQDEPKEVMIVIEKKNGRFRFEIQSENSHRTIIHARGQLYIHDSPAEAHEQAVSRISIEAIKSRCTQQIHREALDNAFQKVGITYGPYFQGLKQVSMNMKDEEALGFLSLPPGYKPGFNQWAYTLHPTIMDGAMQTLVGLTIHQDHEHQRSMLPFAFEKVEILHPLKEQGYAYVKPAGSPGQHRYHVAILDETGRVCVKLHEVALRELKPATPVKLSESKYPADQLEHFFYRPRWLPSPLPELSGLPVIRERPGAASTDEDETSKPIVLVIYPPQGKGLESALAKAHPGDHVIKIKLGSETREISRDNREIKTTDPLAFDNCMGELKQTHCIYFLGGIASNEFDINRQDLLENSLERGVLSLFRLVKSLSKHGFTRYPLQIKVVTNNIHRLDPGETIIPFGACLHGFVASLAKEYSQWKVTCVDICLKGVESRHPDGNGKLQSLAASILAEPGHPLGEAVVLRDGQRYVRKIEGVLLPPKDHDQVPFRQRGVYLILGGTGGIGLELSRCLAKTLQARMILLGRKAQNELNDQQKEKIAEIEAAGGEVLYLQADAANLESMESAAARAKSRFGKINGAIHSAIVLKDKTLENMDEETLGAALAPKVTGSVVFYRALQHEPLDFMMFFSSAQSFTCNPGQSNYAAGCTFKDALALYLDQKTSYPVKIVNWGYWGSVGVVASEEYNKRLASQGVYSITPGEGMEAVRRILAHRLNQVIPFKAETHTIEKMGFDPDRQVQLYPDDTPSLIRGMIHRMEPFLAKSNELDSINRNLSTELEVFIRTLLLDVFHRMGVFKQAGEQYNKIRLRQHLAIVPGYYRLFDALLDIMNRAGFIRTKASDDKDTTPIVTTSALEEETLRHSLKNLRERKRQLAASFPGADLQLKLLWPCVMNYPAILTGKKSHMEVMFPGGSNSLVEGIYKGNQVSDFYNKLVAAAVKAYIRESSGKEADKRINILEVGAGTGGTSTFVLEAIHEYGHRVKYFYTDISRGFTRHGKKTFARKYPFVEFEVLDIDKNPEKQGFESGSIHLVFGTNVFHATRRMTNTLNQVKRLLKTNGVVIINETTQQLDFTTLTFGLTDGWWLYQDEANRIKHSPLLSPGKWRYVLEVCDFRQVYISVPRGITGEDLIQHVIIGESNGEIPVEKPSFAHETPQAKARDKKIPEPPLPAVRGVESLEKIEKMLTGILSDVLHIEPGEIDPEFPFQDYGVDSLLAVEIVDRINNKLEINLRATDLFNYSTTREISNHIVKDLELRIDYPGDTGKEIFETIDQSTQPGMSHEEGFPGKAAPPQHMDNNPDTVMDLLRRLEKGEIDVDDTEKMLEVFNG